MKGINKIYAFHFKLSHHILLEVDMFKNIQIKIILIIILLAIIMFVVPRIYIYK